MRICAQLPGSPGDDTSGAMQQGALTPSGSVLSDAPQPQQPAYLAGTVLDGNGAAIPNAEVSVIGEAGEPRKSVRTDSHGAFAFQDLPPGTYTLTVSARGIESPPSEKITLRPGAKSELPIVATLRPTFETTVHVTANTIEIATAQVQLAEKQRFLGVIPNFYTSYVWQAAPMTPKLKFQLSLRSLVDPVTFGITGGVAGIEQWHNTYPGYGGGAEGYAKRYGATYADTAINRILGSAAFPSIFHQDPRYFYHGSGSRSERLVYAVKESVMCRGDTGRQQLNYSHLLGSFAAAGLSNLYHSPEDRSVALTVRDAFIILGAGAIDNVLREFISHGLTSHIPPGANGKPRGF